MEYQRFQEEFGPHGTQPMVRKDGTEAGKARAW